MPLPTTMTAPKPASSAARRSKSLRILVVDDHPVNLRLIEMLLRKSGYGYDLARSGPEAISFFASHEYDLVLMDICMPGMDGCTTASKLRQMEEEKRTISEAGRRTPIVAVSASPGEEMLDKCHAAGMQAFLSKPVTPPALREILATWVGPDCDPPTR